MSAYGRQVTSDNAALRVGAAQEQANYRVDDAGLRYAVARIRTAHADNPQWQEPVVLTIREKNVSCDVVGLARPRYAAPITLNKTVADRPHAN